MKMRRRSETHQGYWGVMESGHDACLSSVSFEEGEVGDGGGNAW